MVGFWKNFCKLFAYTRKSAYLCSVKKIIKDNV